MGARHELAISELYAIARQAAAGYRRSMPWLDADDLTQAALTEMLAAGQRAIMPPRRWVRYLAAVAYATVRAAAWTTTAPVTLSSDRGSLPAQARAAQRADSAPPEPAPVPGDSDEQLAARRWQRAVRAEVRRALGNDAPADREIARRVLLEDADPAEVAAAAGVPPRQVYVVTQRIKNRILRSPQVQQLWRELPSRSEVADGS